MSVFQVDTGNGNIVEIDAPDAKAAAAAVRKFMANKGTGSAEARPSSLALGGADQKGAKALIPGITPRNAGLAGRVGVETAIEAPFAIPALFGDAAYNAGVFVRNRFAGDRTLGDLVTGNSNKAEYGMPLMNALSNASESAADYVGLPKPETPGEQNAVKYSKVGVGALTGAAAAKLAKGTAEGLPWLARTLGLLSEKPVQQATGAVVGVGTTDAAEKAGVPKEFAIPMGIIAGGVGIPAVSTGGSIIKNVAAPFTQPGQERIVGTTMRNFTSDPQRALNLARTADEFVPGSQPTFAEASRDPGLLGLQSGLMRDATAGTEFGIRRGEQNTARVSALDNAAGMTEAQANRASADLGNAADTAYTGMFGANGTGVPVNIKPINDHIDSIMKSRSGARLPTRQAMDFVKNELDLVNQTNDVGVLYSVRQNIAEALRGKYAGTSKTVDMANVKLAKKELNDVLDVIDNEIDRVAPGYKRLQADYSEQARPISSARTINEITANASKGVPDPIYNQQTLTPAAFRRELENHADEIAKMTPEQQQVLQKVLADIDRSNAVYSPTVRAAGSDTFRNMSVASLISNTFGGGAINNATVRALTKPFGFIFEKLQGDELRSLLTEAMLDPKIGAKMLEKATPENVQTVAEFLRNGAIRNFLSTSARVSANEQEKRQYGGPR